MTLFMDAEHFHHILLAMTQLTDVESVGLIDQEGAGWVHMLCTVVRT